MMTYSDPARSRPRFSRLAVMGAALAAALMLRPAAASALDLSGLGAPSTLLLLGYKVDLAHCHPTDRKGGDGDTGTTLGDPESFRVRVLTGLAESVRHNTRRKQARVHLVVEVEFKSRTNQKRTWSPLLQRWYQEEGGAQAREVFMPLCDPADDGARVMVREQRKFFPVAVASPVDETWVKAAHGRFGSDNVAAESAVAIGGAIEPLPQKEIDGLPGPIYGDYVLAAMRSGVAPFVGLRVQETRVQVDDLKQIGEAEARRVKNQPKPGDETLLALKVFEGIKIVVPATPPQPVAETPSLGASGGPGNIAGQPGGGAAEAPAAGTGTTVPTSAGAGLNTLTAPAPAGEAETPSPGPAANRRPVILVDVADLLRDEALDPNSRSRLRAALVERLAAEPAGACAGAFRPNSAVGPDGRYLEAECDPALLKAFRIAGIGTVPATKVPGDSLITAYRPSQDAVVMADDAVVTVDFVGDGKATRSVAGKTVADLRSDDLKVEQPMGVADLPAAGCQVSVGRLDLAKLLLDGFTFRRELPCAVLDLSWFKSWLAAGADVENCRNPPSAAVPFCVVRAPGSSAKVKIVKDGWAPLELAADKLSAERVAANLRPDTAKFGSNLRVFKDPSAPPFTVTKVRYCGADSGSACCSDPLDVSGRTLPALAEAMCRLDDAPPAVAELSVAQVDPVDTGYLDALPQPIRWRIGGALPLPDLQTLRSTTKYRVTFDPRRPSNADTESPWVFQGGTVSFYRDLASCQGRGRPGIDPIPEEYLGSTDLPPIDGRFPYARVYAQDGGSLSKCVHAEVSGGSADAPPIYAFQLTSNILRGPRRVLVIAPSEPMAGYRDAVRDQVFAFLSEAVDNDDPKPVTVYQVNPDGTSEVLFTMEELRELDAGRRQEVLKQRFRALSYRGEDIQPMRALTALWEQAVGERPEALAFVTSSRNETFSENAKARVFYWKNREGLKTFAVITDECGNWVNKLEVASESCRTLQEASSGDVLSKVLSDWLLN